MGSTLRLATVVTGASEGIGYELALIAARESSPVVLVARSADALSQVARTIRANGGEAHPVVLDLARPEAAALLEAALVERSLLCNVLINNAGVGLTGPFSELPPEGQLTIIDVNVRALTALALRFVPGMMERRSGGMINLASVAGYLPGPNMAVYFASKAFVRSFSEGLHAEMRGSGVTVTCLAPGPVATRFLAKSGARRTRLFKIAPKLTAAAVAQAGWRGFKSGKRVVIPGVTAPLFAFAGQHLPHQLTLLILARLTKGG